MARFIAKLMRGQLHSIIFERKNLWQVRNINTEVNYGQLIVQTSSHSLSLSNYYCFNIMATQLRAGHVFSHRMFASTKVANRALHTVPKRQDAVATESIGHQPAGMFASLTIEELIISVQYIDEIGEEIIATFSPAARSTPSHTFSYKQYFDNQIQQKKDDKVRPIYRLHNLY
jgi:hypothetical protein